MEEYAAKDARVKVLHSDVNSYTLETHASMREYCPKPEVEYIVWLDADIGTGCIISCFAGYAKKFWPGHDDLA